MAPGWVAQRSPLSEMAPGGGTGVGNRELSTVLGFNLRIVFYTSRILV